MWPNSVGDKLAEIRPSQIQLNFDRGRRGWNSAKFCFGLIQPKFGRDWFGWMRSNFWRGQLSRIGACVDLWPKSTRLCLWAKLACLDLWFEFACFDHQPEPTSLELRINLPQTLVPTDSSKLSFWVGMSRPSSKTTLYRPSV